MGNQYLDPPEDANSSRWVDTCTWPQRIEKDGGITFTPNAGRKDYRRLKDTFVKPNTIIYCTGYTQSFSWFHPSYPTPSSATCRNIVDPSDPSIAFIGFVRPGVGAIPPISEQQSMWWMAHVLGHMPKLPMSEPHYHLLSPSTARIKYGVDHSAYMSTLAKDMGAMPSLLTLWVEYGWKVLLIYAFGASFTSFYRLTGPFKDPSMKNVVEGELKDTVMRRGITGNLFFGLIPMIFYGILNATALLLEMLGILRSDATMTVDEKAAGINRLEKDW